MTEKYLKCVETDLSTLLTVEAVNAKMKGVCDIEFIVFFLMVANVAAWDNKDKIRLTDPAQGEMYWYIMGLFIDAVEVSGLEVEGLSKSDGSADGTLSSLEKMKLIKTTKELEITLALESIDVSPYDYKEYFCVEPVE